jgi:DNA-binding response OmpR family regulator
MTRILLLEDDLSLGETLCERLEREGYSVTWSKAMGDALSQVKKQGFELFIVDLGLPDGDGFEFVKEIRSVSSSPFIFMTALNTAENRLAGYELGAEEFIPKPFHLKELLLRVRHVLKEHSLPEVIKYKGIKVSLQEGSVERTGEPKTLLSDRDAQLLRLLVRRAPQVVSREDILNLWVGDSSYPSTRTVDNAIVRLRQALGDEANEIIRSVRGAGYQWLLHRENKI